MHNSISGYVVKQSSPLVPHHLFGDYLVNILHEWQAEVNGGKKLPYRD
jgi:hypothetical protein